MTINLNQLGDSLSVYSAMIKAHQGRVGALSAEALVDILELVRQVHTCYGYLITMAEQSEAGGHHVQTGYVIAGINKRGEFNKWSKAFGAKPYSVRNQGTNFVHPGDADAGVFFDIGDATMALESMSPDIRKYFGIFPVVICAGNNQHSEVEE